MNMQRFYGARVCGTALARWRYAMLELVFSQTAGSEPTKSVGPVPSFRIEGGLIRLSRDAAVTARHADHSWELNDRKYFRMDCTGPLTVEFWDAEGRPVKKFGPFHHFSAADGIAYIDRNHFASYAESTGLWFCRIAGGSWPVMVIEAVRTPKSDA
jgi:hypothetical protein